MIFFPLDTFAAYTNYPHTTGRYYYIINGNRGNDGFDSYTPVELLSGANGFSKSLYALETSFNLGNEHYSGTYYTNGGNFFVQLRNSYNDGYNNFPFNNSISYIAYSNVQTPKTGTCSVYSNTSNYYITYKCNVEYQHNEYPVSVDVTIGKNNYSEDPITTTYSDNENVYLQTMYFELYSNNYNSNTTDLTDTNNKIDDVKDSVDDVNDSLNNSSPVPNSDVEDVFEDFDFYENSSLSSIITAPLDFLDSLTDPCEPITLEVFHTNISLQCGTTLFWENPDLFGNDDSIGQFPTIWNILFGGLIIYRLCRKLFKVINEALDPEKDSVEGCDI